MHHVSEGPSRSANSIQLLHIKKMDEKSIGYGLKSSIFFKVGILL